MSSGQYFINTVYASQSWKMYSFFSRDTEYADFWMLCSMQDDLRKLKFELGHSDECDNPWSI